MGIQGLTKLLGDSAPGCMKEQKFENYFGRKIAVDASMHIYSFLVVVGRTGDQLLTSETGEITSHLLGMFFRTTRMLEAGIKPIFVFEGSAPDLKRQELAKRSTRREGANQDLEAARDAGDQEAIEKYSKRTVRVTRQHNEECKRLLGLMGVPILEAPTEAEAQCAELCKAGLVYGISTEDMDSLTFGCPRLIRHLMAPASQKVAVMEFDYEAVLRELALSREQFVDLCILCGCDYTDKISGIGAIRALSLIQKHGCIEKVLEALDPEKYKIPDPFPYEDARKLFNEPGVLTGDQVPQFKWNAPDLDGLIDFLVKEKNFAEDRVRRAVERIVAAKSKGAQGRLESFFGPVKVHSSTLGKRKEEAPKGPGSKKGPVSKKGKAGGVGRGKANYKSFYSIIHLYHLQVSSASLVTDTMKLRSALLLAIALGISNAVAQDLCRKHTIVAGDTVEILKSNYGYQGTLDEFSAALMAQPAPFNVPDGVSLALGQVIGIPLFPPACAFIINSPSDKVQCKLYETQPGDTIQSVVEAFGISSNVVADLNGISTTDMLQPGNFLKLPGWTDSVCIDPSKDVQQCRVYRSKEGDSLDSISRLFKVSPQTTQDLNPSYISNLPLGSLVKLYPYPVTCGNNAVEVDGPGITGEKCRKYRIQQGDILENVAKSFGLNIQQIVDSNPDLLANPALLTVGYVIRVPPFDESCGDGYIVNDGDGPTPTPVVVPPSGPLSPASPVSPSLPLPNMIPPPLNLSPPVQISPMIAPSPAPMPTPIPAPAPAPSSAMLSSLAGVALALFTLF